MRTTQRFYRVDRRQISLVKFIFEAYEGVAVVTTTDAAAGVVVLSVAPGCERLAERIMADLGRHFRIEPRQEPSAMQQSQVGSS